MSCFDEAPKASEVARMAEKSDANVNMLTKTDDMTRSNCSDKSQNISAASKTAHNVAGSGDDESLQHDNRGTTSTDDDDIDNDPEVMLLTKFRLALGSTFRMLECARDDLVRLGERMDRLTIASRECRERLEAQQQVQQRRGKSTSGEASS